VTTTTYAMSVPIPLPIISDLGSLNGVGLSQVITTRAVMLKNAINARNACNAHKLNQRCHRRR